MKIYFRSIELFGVSGAGKTYIREKIKRKLVSNEYKVFNVREMIILNINKCIELNYFEKISLSYFSFLLKFNITTTLWNKILYSITEKFIKIERKKFIVYQNKLNKIFKKLEDKKFYNYKLWLRELIISTIIFEKIKKKNKYFIFFPDEGFLQKVFLLNYIKKNISINHLKKFLNNNIFCDLIINVQSTKINIERVMQQRIKTRSGWILNNKEIKKMFLFEKKVIDSKILKFKKIKNYYKTDNQINKLFDSKFENKKIKKNYYIG